MHTSEFVWLSVYAGVAAGGKPGRCGWRWCLDSLVPSPGPEEERDIGAGEDQRSKVAAAIRKLRA